MRKDCPMRGNLGNCTPVGGFCMDAVSDEICEAVHNAYQHGYSDSIKRLEEQKKHFGEANEMVKLIFDEWSWKCENCKSMMALPGIIPSLEMLKEKGWKYCPICGEKIDFNASEANKPEWIK